MRLKIWNSVIFFNYLQAAMGGPREAGTAEQYHQAGKAFFEVIGKYQPEYVIVWGKRLWNNLPNVGWQDADDIPDIVARWNNLEAENERTPYDKSFFITKQEIVDNGYVFSFNKYHKKEIVKKEYRPTSEIIKSNSLIKHFGGILINQIGSDIS